MRSASIIAVLLAASAAHSQEQSTSTNGPVIIVDGDTLKVDGVTIRLLGIDTPETYRSRCEAELVLGLKAKERLRQLVDAGRCPTSRTAMTATGARSPMSSLATRTSATCCPPRGWRCPTRPAQRPK